MGDKHKLRDYKGHRFYDLGPYENTGQNQIDIYPIDYSLNAAGEESAESIFSVYYESGGPGSLNKGIEQAKEWVNNKTPESNDQPAAEVKKEKKAGKKKQTATTAERKCRVCGCTQDNCQQCIDKTGGSCHWVEDDLCSACVENTDIPVTDTRAAVVKETNQSNNSTTMDFFQQLSANGHNDITLRIMKVNDKYTVELKPGSAKSYTKPYIVTGTPEDLDESFFSEIAPGVKTISGIVSNIDEVKKDVEEKAAAKKTAKAPAPKKKVSKPAATKKSPPKKKAAAPKIAKKPGASQLLSKPTFKKPTKKTEKKIVEKKPAAPKVEAVAEEPKVIEPSLFS